MKTRLLIGAVISLAASFTHAQTTKWAVDFANAIITRWPSTINDMTGKGWEYSNGSILYGMEKVYEQTKNADYLNYIKKYVDAYVDANGNVNYDSTVHSLDKIQPGALCVFLYKETGLQKYKTAAANLRAALAKQPKNAEGGFWHKDSYPNQMLTDGIFMAEPFLSKYGFLCNDMEFCDSTATFQPLLLASHVYISESKLLLHAWDQSKKAAWADPTTGLSPCVWSRGMGWFSAAMVDIITYLPKDHPRYNDMATLLANFAEGIKNTQDPATGLWYQVTDKGSQSDDFIESSGSGLFIYTLKKAADCGLIDKSYLAVAQKGWTGLKTKITLDGQGLPVINGYVGAMSALASYALYVGQTLVACPPSVHPHGYCAILMAASAMELQTVPKYRLSITIVGQGSVNNPSGEMFLDSGTTVSLTATPGSNYHFSQWTGDASGTAATAAVTMNSEKNIAATFSQGASIKNTSLPKGDGSVHFSLARHAMTITFTLRSAQKVVVEIFNSDGRKVGDFTRGIFASGNHSLDLKTQGFAAGLYFIKIKYDRMMHSAPLTIFE
jgi:unsaturated rhamnogalacturonyl hydrolase